MLKDANANVYLIVQTYGGKMRKMSFSSCQKTTAANITNGGNMTLQRLTQKPVPGGSDLWPETRR